MPAGAAEPGSGLPEAEADLALSPVKAPDNIFGVATLRAPARTLDMAFAWTKLGLDWRALLSAGPAAEILPVLDLDAPVDVVLTLDPKQKSQPRVLFAASVGLSSRQAALDAFRNMGVPAEFVEPGVHSVRPSPKTLCFVAAALGKAKARLVCSEDRATLDLLSPYMTRGNPSANTGDADLHVELRAETPWRLFGDKTQFLKLAVPMALGEASLGNPEFDGALRDAANAIVDEVILGLEDADAIRLDAWLRETEQELEARLSVDFHGTKSWLGRTLRDSAGREGTAPEVFWKLPGDATEAIHYSASNPETMKGALPVLERLLRGGLSHLGASAAIVQAWPRAFNDLLLVPGPVVSARGNVPAALAGNPADAHAQVRASLGWTLVGTEDENARYGAFFEQTLKLYEDAALRRGLAKNQGLDTAKLPKVQSRKGPARLPDSRIYEVSLPPSLYAEIAPESGAAKLDKPIPFAILVCRDGRRTWLGLSSYADLLEERMAALLGTPDPASTLDRKSGLERLRREKSLVGGFWTLAGLQSSAAWGKTGLGEALAPLGQSKTPIIGRTLARAEGPNGTVYAHVPSQLFAEIAAALQGRAP